MMQESEDDWWDWSDMPDVADEDQFRCEKCRGIFDIDDSVKHDDAYYCVSCAQEMELPGYQWWAGDDPIPSS